MMHVNFKQSFNGVSVVIACVILTSCEWNSSFLSSASSQPHVNKVQSHTTMQPVASPSVIEQDTDISSDKSTPSSTHIIAPTLSNRFDPSKPSLLGLRLGDSYERMIQLVGKTKSILPIDDPDGSYTIYTYPHFSIGLDIYKKILFISIDSKRVDPRLAGVRVGQSINQAIRILGTPHSKTDVVVNYMSDTSILKIDIDSQTQSILSIKLFGR